MLNVRNVIDMKTRTKALWAVIVGNSIFGFSFLFSKIALELTIPSVMLAVRFLTAFLVLNLVVIVGITTKKLEFNLKGKPLKDILLLALFQPVIYFVAESYGITYTSSAFAGTIIAIIPIAGILCDVFILQAKVSGKQIMCSVASVVGVIITTLGAQNMKSSFIGVSLLLIAVAAGALFYVFSKKAGNHFNALERTYVMFAVGSVTYLMIALVECRGAYDTIAIPALTTPMFWGCIIYLSVISSVMAFLLLNFGSSYISVSEASIFANLTTVISIVAGVLFVNETFTLWQVIGAVIIVGSVYVSSIGKKV